MPCIDGKTYIKRIDNLKNNVWIDGRQITGNISEHPAFKGAIKTQASLFDLQCDKRKIDFMTYKSPSSGEPVGISYLQPTSIGDLRKRRIMIQEWAHQTFGLMGRTPDYMNTVLMALTAANGLLSKEGSENLNRYYTYCRENDITLTHTFIQPQVNRSELFFENPNDSIAAKMVRKTDEGIVIHGARLLATQGGMTDEILVLPAGNHIGFDSSYAYAFAIPSNTKGLKFICRESFDYGKSFFNHPLSTRFEEMDAIVIFDNVLVPWNRVFLYENLEVAPKLKLESSFFEHTLHQIVSRLEVKFEFILGLIQSIVDTINIDEYLHVKNKISEVIVGLEAIRSFLTASEVNARIDKWGVMTPNLNPLLSAMNYYPWIYPRCVEVINLIGASGLISLPTEEEFYSSNEEDLQKYLQSATKDGYNRVKLFRLAWDLCMSPFGTRQTLYERFFFGDPERLGATLYEKYDKKEYVSRIRTFLNSY